MKGKFTKEVIYKCYAPSEKHYFLNELFYYKHFYEFAPRLIDHDEVKQVLIIEKLVPLAHVDNNILYRDRLWELLENLHRHGANHRDITVDNVVVKGDQLLLIDWQEATPSIGDKSADLYDPVTVGVEPKTPNVWWGAEFWDKCPARYWNEL